MRKKPRNAGAPCSPIEYLGGTVVDGYFIAIPTHLAVKMFELANAGSRVCDALASGHNEHGKMTVYVTPEICEILNEGAAEPKEGCEEEDVPLPVEAQRSFLDWINSPWVASEHQ